MLIALCVKWSLIIVLQTLFFFLLKVDTVLVVVGKYESLYFDFFWFISITNFFCSLLSLARDKEEDNLLLEYIIAGDIVEPPPPLEGDELKENLEDRIAERVGVQRHLGLIRPIWISLGKEKKKFSKVSYSKSSIQPIFYIFTFFG